MLLVLDASIVLPLVALKTPQAEHLDDTSLLTADSKIRNAPTETLPCNVLTSPG